MILYKYLSPNRLDVLRDRLVRFTQPAAFNDPFEFRPVFGDILPDGMLTDYLKANYEREIDEAMATVPAAHRAATRKMLLERKGDIHAYAMTLRDIAAPMLRKTLSGKFTEVMNEQAGILCLSEVRDSPLMWGHYANCHTGLVLGFDSEHPFFNKKRGPNDEFGFVRRVVYSASRPLLTLQSVESADVFQTKSDEWAYEKEWRLMRVLGEATKRVPQNPFPVCLFEFEPDAVREIIVGMRATPGLVSEVERLVAKFPRASMFAAREHPSAYALIVE